jgi:hypothetical protein
MSCDMCLWDWTGDWNVESPTGKGINWEVTYLGPNLSDRILKHKIRTQNNTAFLVDGILLSSIDVLDVATIPITPEQYQVDLSKLTEFWS